MRERFSRVAPNYSAGSVWHGGAEPLAEVVAFCHPEPGDRVLDVATGAGNTALALAPQVRFAVGLDLTEAMLAEARRQAAGRGVANVSWVLGDAQRLPFEEGAFDLYAVRAAPHHFPDPDRALREAARVLRAGGRAVLIDCAPPAEARELLHAVEVGRDPSHRRSWTLEEWRQALEAAGLSVQAAEVRARDWDFEAWMDRMAVPAPRREELAGFIEGARGEAARQLSPRRVEGRLWFTYWHCFLRAARP